MEYFSVLVTGASREVNVGQFAEFIDHHLADRGEAGLDRIFSAGEWATDFILNGYGSDGSRAGDLVVDLVRQRDWQATLFPGLSVLPRSQSRQRCSKCNGRGWVSQ